MTAEAKRKDMARKKASEKARDKTPPKKQVYQVDLNRLKANYERAQKSYENSKRLLENAKRAYEEAQRNQRR